MPYVDPQTVSNPTSGSVAPAAWGDAVRDATQYLANPPKVRCYNSALISVANSTGQALTFNSERFDTDTMHSTSVNTSRITFTTAGTYLVGGSLQWDTNTTGYRSVSLRLNGATPISNVSSATRADGFLDQSISSLYAFAAADYLELVVIQTSGGALNVPAAGNNSPEFYAVWVSL